MLLLTLLFFFGPALLMFALHRVAMVARYWWLMRGLQHQHDVIDITPTPPRRRPGTVFIVVSMLVASVFAGLAWQRMQSTPQNIQTQYVPAHIDTYGNMVPGAMQPLPSIENSNAPQH
ncbi:MAG: hypothetical protein R8K50_00595 [Mariprofundus sp.]